LTGIVSILNEDPGAAPVTVQRDTAAGTPPFRIIEIAPFAKVVISGLIINNGADSLGGGILVSSELTLRRCTVSNSTASDGGGIAIVRPAIVDATDCTFTGNSSTRSGGGVYTGTSLRTSLTNCTISNNTSVNGGGLKMEGGGIGTTPELRIKNCTFTGNSVRDSGGAIYDSVRDPDRVTIMSSTITGNVAGYKGGGIIAYNGDVGPYLRLGNNIIAGNRCDTFGDVYGHDLSPGQYVSDGHNILGRQPRNVVFPGQPTTGLVNGVKGDQVGTEENPINPNLGALQMNGGITPTHALLPGSPAINNGDSALAPARDQRRYARPDGADVGAFEFGGSYPLPLRNISTRGRVGSDIDVLIAGFVITGTEPKRVMVRAIGPSLGIPGELANPRLDLWNSAGQVLAANDDWNQAPNRQEIIDSTLAPTDAAESAILVTLSPGAYSAVVNGVNNTTGVGLVELYDLGTAAKSTLANISTRGVVGSGDDVMIGGFIVSGPGAETVIVRGLGPSLPFPRGLADPVLELHDQNGALLRANDNWRADQKDEIERTGIPPSYDEESALVSSVVPSNYTAILRGANGSTGVGLIEIYALD
jgi:predicted outer membrane repeat protein